jgi:predicted N-formylglutamate amidohydrolase
LNPAARPDEDWPAPVDVINEEGRSEIVLICEHASHHMPAEYGDLGLPASELRRHIAWDIGAAEMARGLARRLDAACFLGTYSRLLVDLNRPLDSPSAMPVISENTPIPGNVGLSASERQRRIDRMFEPFHNRVAAYLDRRDLQGRTTRVVAIHSFTPVFLGVARPWHAGILFDRGRSFAEQVIARLAEDTSVLIGANVPYVVDRQEDYAVPVHGDDRNYPAILVEVRQDLLATGKGIAEWADRLAAALTRDA